MFLNLLVTDGKQEKFMASRGCFYGGGSVSAEAFCNNITVIDPDADCHFCRPDACNKADGLSISMAFILVTVLSAVIGF